MSFLPWLNKVLSYLSNVFCPYKHWGNLLSRRDEIVPSRRDHINRPSVTLLCPMPPTLPRFEQAGIYIVWYLYIVYNYHRILLNDFPTNLLLSFEIEYF
jgi:hypothetical protein